MIEPILTKNIDNYLYALWQNYWGGKHEYLMDIVSCKNKNILGFRYTTHTIIGTFKIKLKPLK